MEKTKEFAQQWIEEGKPCVYRYGWGWKRAGDKHFCDNCWNWDDDDCITTKDGRRFNEEGEEIV